MEPLKIYGGKVIFSNKYVLRLLRKLTVVSEDLIVIES